MKFMNPGDFVKIGLIAFLFVFLANRALTKFGLGGFVARGNSIDGTEAGA